MWIQGSLPLWPQHRNPALNPDLIVCTPAKVYVSLSIVPTTKPQPSTCRRTSKSRELSFDDPPVGNFPLFNSPLDVALWSQSVSGASVSGKDIFFSQQDLQDMSGHLEPFIHKDDNRSVSSMGDSAYQSQPDAAARRATAVQTRSPQESRSQVGEQFLGHEIYSPSMNSDNFNTFQGPQSDMAQMLLPPSAGESDLGEGMFAMSDFTNYSTQTFGHYQGATMHRFTPSSEIDMSQSWATADVQSYSAPFAVQNADMSSYMPQRQASQRFFTPLVYNQSISSTNTVSSLDAPRRARQPHLDTTGLDSVRSSTPASARQHHPRRLSNSDQAFRNLVASPTSSVLSSSQHFPPTESDYREQSSAFIEPVKMEKVELASAPIGPQSEKDDDFEEEILSPTQAAAAQNLEDTEGKLARTHPLYQAQPSDDDLYHCPNEGQAGCNHKPTKLKCNYDKYVDSHLRPFRCKVKTCVGVQFSSTACLLRHEREAHGMHGHGSKPHLCTYADCERSVPGNGFPRRYNLYDHMKRVHDYNGSTISPTERVTPPSQGAQPTWKRQSSRKRKQTSVDDISEKRQKTTAVKATTPPAVAAHNQAVQRKQVLQSEFEKRKDEILQALKDLQDPKDLDGLQLNEDILALQKISLQLKGLG